MSFRPAAVLAFLALLPAPAAAQGTPALAPAARLVAQRRGADTVPLPPSYGAALARGTRDARGAPGPRYWQQRVRYRIDAELDPRSTLLRGRERVVYHNASPDTLRSVVLNLNQNVYAPGVPRNRYAPVTGGITLDRDRYHLLIHACL